MNKIYLDNAATTSVDPEVLKAMRPYFLVNYGNPSQWHLLGRKARQAVEESRSKLADFFGASQSEFIFTASATESINLAHKGLVEALRLASFAQDRPHIITTQVEHKAVLEACKHLAKSKQAIVTYLKPDRHGRIDLKELAKAIKDNTVLVSVMYVNNEVGTVEPIRRIGLLLKAVNKKRKRKIFFHTDATQAVNYFNCRVDYLGADLLSFTGHKINAPKGIGALYVRKGTPLLRQTDGGGQEFNLRAGTENVPYIVGLGKAIEMIKRSKGESGLKKTINLRDKLIKGVLAIPGTELTGHPIQRAPHIASFIINGVEGEAMVLALSDLGIYASSGSACTASDLAASHVLTAMGYPPEVSHGSLRFSLGKNTTEAEVNYTLDKLPQIIKKLRQMAPKI